MKLLAKIAITAFMFCCLHGYAQSNAFAVSPAENDSMRKEADAFIKAMPADLQLRQTRAIRKAIDGDCADLQNVRNARNSEITYSPGVSVRMITPQLRLYEPTGCCENLPLLIYLHGGGWTFGSLNSCARFCDAVAASGKVKVLAVDYALAPEHPFPEGLNDCINAVKYAANHCSGLGIDPQQISIGGDSSGGNLAIATALSVGEDIDISRLILFYPVTKAYSDESRSWKKYGIGYGLDADIMCAFNDAYTRPDNPHNQLISVAENANLQSLPRILLVAAGRDILCDQGKEFASALSDKVTRIEFPDAVHLFITVPGQQCAFHKAVEIALNFIK